MNCHDVEHLLASRRDLSPAEEEVVREHMAHCPICRQDWEREKQTSAVLHTLRLGDTLPPERVQTRVHAMLEQKPRHPYWQHGLALTSIGAVVLLFLVLIAGQATSEQTVTSSPTATTNMVMPQVIGWTEEQAMEHLKEMGIDSIYIDYQDQKRINEDLNALEPGKVFTTTPGPGEPLDPDTLVVLGIPEPYLFTSLGRIAYIHNGFVWIKVLPDLNPIQVTTEGQSHSPQWSPSGEWLTYCMDERLWIVNGMGYDPRELGDCRATWLSDPDTLIYRDGDAMQKVIAGEWGVEPLPRHGVWSPDQTEIAYVEMEVLDTVDETNTPEREVSLWRAEADGLYTTELFSPGSPAEYDIRLVGWYGDEIVFRKGMSFSNSLSTDGTPLYTISENGGEPRELVPWMLGRYFDVAADEHSFVVAAGGDRQTWHNKRIAVGNFADGLQVYLTDENTAAVSPQWSPDAQHIIYAAGPDIGPIGGGDEAREGLAQRRIWRIDRDGENPRQLTHDERYRDEQPGWSADGEHILFVRLAQDDIISLWLMPAEGGEPVQVANELGPISTPSDSVWFGYYGHTSWEYVFDWWSGDS
ncbi:MAG: PASTA domain-containing protein [Chloroflexota bacterium]